MARLSQFAVLLLLQCSVFCLFSVAAADDQIVVINVHGMDNTAGYTAQFGPRFPSKSTAVSASILKAEPFLACEPILPVNGAIPLIMRGNCTFVKKVLNAQAAGAIAVIVINNEGDNEADTMKGDGVDDTGVTIPSVMVSHNDGMDLCNKETSMVKLYGYERRFLDVSIGFMFVIAVCTVAGAAYWSAQKEREAAATALPGAPPQVRPPEAEEEIAYMTVWSAVCFLVMASGLLVLLFFFMSVLVWVIIVVFVLGGVSSSTTCISSLITWVFSTRKQINLPLLGPVALVDFLVFWPCLAAGITWAVIRNHTNAWILQDFMGICLLLVLQKTIRLPNIKVALILLSLAFVYDIFWVFISPLIFKQSVMVHVATGAGSGEAIPLLIRLPKLKAELPEYNMLGLGDIALPGLFVSFLIRFDVRRNLKPLNGYFLVSLIGYAVGIILTDLALYLTEKGQPALLYLVPCIFIPSLTLAWYRRDIKSMWSGEEPVFSENNCERSTSASTTAP